MLQKNTTYDYFILSHTRYRIIKLRVLHLPSNMKLVIWNSKGGPHFCIILFYYVSKNNLEIATDSLKKKKLVTIILWLI